MLSNEEENIKKLKEYTRLLEGLEFMFVELSNIKEEPKENKKAEKKLSIKKETKTCLSNHEISKLILESELHKNKLILLEEKQALDENESYQKIMDLFLEENETIPKIELENGDPNKYLLTQLFTAFSLYERNIYLNRDNKDISEKKINFLKILNNIKFNKESKLTPQILEYFNHNILKIEDIYQSKENKNNLNNENPQENTEEMQVNKKVQIIEAKEIKKPKKSKKEKNKDLNNQYALDSSEDYGNIILNDELNDMGVGQIDKISYQKNYENIDLNNEEYKKMKSVNMRKILELEDDKLKNITQSEFEELIKEVYSSGEVKDKILEYKITGGEGKLFNNDLDDIQNIKVTNNNISLPNDIEISLNQEEKMENEEIIDDKEIPDFDQEEIKNQPNKTLFFEKDEFEKEFFSSANISEKNKEIIEDKKDENNKTENLSLEHN